jgi:hypothetical protein
MLVIRTEVARAACRRQASSPRRLDMPYGSGAVAARVEEG